jgi:hypothetical protein
VDPLAQRILAEIQDGHLSVEDRQALATALSQHQAGHPNPNAKWSSTLEFLVDLCEWAAALPAEDLPPREADAATYFACTGRTIRRWLEKAEIPDWDGFLRFWALALR